MSGGPLVWRPASPGDAATVIAAIDAWWPGTPMVHGVCPQLLEHFGDTCIIVEDDGRLVALLVGFMSQRFVDAGYVHYMGVHPDRRGSGLGREMYERFARITRERGRTEILAEAGAWNAKSIAFHTHMGFALEPGDEIVDGLPIRHPQGHGFDYVAMLWRLGDEPGERA